MNESNIITPDKYIDNIDFLKNYEKLKANNISSNKLSKYEITTIVGIRATQLSLGVEPLIKVPNNINDVVQIAELELEQKKTPFIIERDLNTKKEYWKIEDMI